MHYNKYKSSKKCALDINTWQYSTVQYSTVQYSTVSVDGALPGHKVTWFALNQSVHKPPETKNHFTFTMLRCLENTNTDEPRHTRHIQGPSQRNSLSFCSLFKQCSWFNTDLALFFVLFSKYSNAFKIEVSKTCEACIFVNALTWIIHQKVYCLSCKGCFWGETCFLGGWTSGYVISLTWFMCKWILPHINKKSFLISLHVMQKIPDYLHIYTHTYINIYLFIYFYCSCVCLCILYSKKCLNCLGPRTFSEVQHIC